MNLGDRIKRYERTFARDALYRTPVMIRVDGRAFHTVTQRLLCEKPFDAGLMRGMVAAALYVARNMQGFKAGYVQSDEATFCLTDYDTLETQGWFDYDIDKMISLSAAMMSMAFCRELDTINCFGEMPVFDGRAFSLPVDDVVNAFLWRAKDWERNGLSMYVRSFFSHKQLQGKHRADMHEMLHGIGKNWATDLSNQARNGTFLIMTETGIKTRSDILPAYGAINEAIGHLF